MKLAYDRRGHGSPVLLVHAGIADRRMWAPQLEGLAGGFDLVAADLPGFGGSPSPAEPTWPGAARLELLDDLGLERVAVAGCSLGGSTALDFALEHPERVRRLVLIDAGISGLPLGQNDRALFAEVEAAEDAGDLDRLNQAEVRLWLDGPGRPAGHVGDPARSLVLQMNGDSLRRQGEWDGSLWRALDPPAGGRLAEVATPTLVLVGEHDLPHCHEAAAILARSLPAARLHVIPDAAHLPSLERPERVNPLLEAFLREEA